MMKSLRSTGRDTTSRICWMYLRFPPKNCSSVRQEMAAAPPFSYAVAMAAASKSSRINPAEGLLRFTSAMTLVLPRVCPLTTAPKKFREGSQVSTTFCSSSRGLSSFARSTSPRLCAMISLSVIGMLSCIFKGTAGLAVLEEGVTYFQVI